jgi:hypothetical protein
MPSGMVARHWMVTMEMSINLFFIVLLLKAQVEVQKVRKGADLGLVLAGDANPP